VYYVFRSVQRHFRYDECALSHWVDATCGTCGQRLASKQTGKVCNNTYTYFHHQSMPLVLFTFAYHTIPHHTIIVRYTSTSSALPREAFLAWYVPVLVTTPRLTISHLTIVRAIIGLLRYTVVLYSRKCIPLKRIVVRKAPRRSQWTKWKSAVKKAKQSPQN
jgi:hypothetical protein